MRSVPSILVQAQAFVCAIVGGNSVLFAPHLQTAEKPLNSINPPSRSMFRPPIRSKPDSPELLLSAGLFCAFSSIFAYPAIPSCVNFTVQRGKLAVAWPLSEQLLKVTFRCRDGSPRRKPASKTEPGTADNSIKKMRKYGSGPVQWDQRCPAPCDI